MMKPDKSKSVIRREALQKDEPMPDLTNYPEKLKMRRQLIRNAFHCHTCDTIIESKHHHDFVVCKCPYESETFTAVDGGLSYSRRVGGLNGIDLCEYENDT